MSEAEKSNPAAATGEETPAAPPSVDGKFQELAELEQEIRRRLRSNQRFLEKFLDEDFVDDEPDGEGEAPEDEEEEL